MDFEKAGIHTLNTERTRARQVQFNLSPVEKETSRPLPNYEDEEHRKPAIKVLNSKRGIKRTVTVKVREGSLVSEDKNNSMTMGNERRDFRQKQKKFQGKEDRDRPRTPIRYEL